MKVTLSAALLMLVLGYMWTTVFASTAFEDDAFDDDAAFDDDDAFDDAAFDDDDAVFDDDSYSAAEGQSSTKVVVNHVYSGKMRDIGRSLVKRWAWLKRRATGLSGQAASRAAEKDLGDLCPWTAPASQRADNDEYLVRYERDTAADLYTNGTADTNRGSSRAQARPCSHHKECKNHGRVCCPIKGRSGLFCRSPRFEIKPKKNGVFIAIPKAKK